MKKKDKYLQGCASGESFWLIEMTEPDADLLAALRPGIKDGNEYVLNGSNVFISNGELADLAIVAAKTSPALGTSGVSLFLVEKGTPGFERGQRIEKIGMHVQDTTELFFEDCRIPESNLLGIEGQGFKYLMQKLQQERLVVAMGSQTLRKESGIQPWLCQGTQCFGQPWVYSKHSVRSCPNSYSRCK